MDGICVSCMCETIALDALWISLSTIAITLIISKLKRNGQWNFKNIDKFESGREEPK